MITQSRGMMFGLLCLLSCGAWAAEPSAPTASPFDKTDPEIQQLRQLNWKSLDLNNEDLRSQCTTMYALSRILDVLGSKADARADLLVDYLEENKLGEAFAAQLSEIPEPPQITYVDAQKIAQAFLTSPLGKARFGGEFANCDDTLLRGYLGMYARKSQRAFNEVIESRHQVRAMGLFLEKQGKLKEFNQWADAERQRRQQAFEQQAKQKREQDATAEAARRAAAQDAIAEKRRQEQEQAAQQMALAMQFQPTTGGQPQSSGGYDDDYWGGNWWAGAYYASSAYRGAVRDKVNDRIGNWRPRPAPRGRPGRR